MNTIKKLLVLIVMTLSSLTGAHAASVSLFSPVLTVADGDTFSMQLVGTGFNDGTLDGGGVNISFDASVINITSVTIDTATWEFFSTEGVIDNTAGSVDGISFNSFQTRTGDLLFATIEFSAVGSGFSALSLSEYTGNPFASGGSVYTSLNFDQSASVTVSSVPVPAAAWLFISGLGLLVTRVRKTG